MIKLIKSLFSKNNDYEDFKNKVDESNLKSLEIAKKRRPLKTCEYCKSQTPCKGSYPEGCFHEYMK